MDETRSPRLLSGAVTLPRVAAVILVAMTLAVGLNKAGAIHLRDHAPPDPNGFHYDVR